MSNPYQTAAPGKNLPGAGKKVVVAMSGGVDSAVAAALLKEQGYEVVGITLQTTDYSKYLKDDSGGSCCSAKDIEDARRVAEKLDIPFYVLDTEDAFDDLVVNYFVNEYVQGRTPNPCVMCNTKVKFEHLHKKAMDMGADFVATGHYAKVSHEPGMGYALWKGDDEGKDQTYFLFGLTQAKLSRALFPLGGFKKDDVRKMADKFGLTVAQKPDSQEICFVANNKYAQFVEDRTAPTQRKNGFIVDIEKNVLGEHDGVFRFTIGQRKGLIEHFYKHIQSSYKGIENLRVLRLDPMKGTVIVGPEENLLAWGLHASRANWIVPPDLRQGRLVQAKIRYRSESVWAELHALPDNRIELRFAEPVRAVTPGQAVVLYDGNLCLGGAWIEGPLRIAPEDRPRVRAEGVTVLKI